MDLGLSLNFPSNYQAQSQTKLVKKNVFVPYSFYRLSNKYLFFSDFTQWRRKLKSGMGPNIEKSIWDQSGINPGFNPGCNLGFDPGPRLTIRDLQIDHPGPRLKNPGSMRDPD